MPLTTSEDVHGGLELEGNKTIVNSTPVDGHGNVTDVTLSMITIGNFKFQVELEQYMSSSLRFASSPRQSFLEGSLLYIYILFPRYKCSHPVFR